MARLLERISVELPVLAAPMAGGASTTELVAAAGRAGSLGFVAAGYKSPEALSEQIDAVRAERVPFGVNLFAPNPVPIAEGEFRRYAEALEPEANRHGLSTRDARAVTDDDHWADKLEVLRSDPVPLVSFTFGLADPTVVASLRRAGSLVVPTVTSAAEARAAAETGADGLIVQASQAGGHSATFTPGRPRRPVPLTEVIAETRHATTLPVIAAGG
ncbi:MAG: nitronate monooxygenase, partial [Stackebrandtia sp.]